MAGNGPDEIDRLLREVESTLGGAPGRPPAGRAEAVPRRRRRGALPTATAAAAAAGVLIFVLFVLLPFLGAISGAAGAFLGVFGTVLIGRLRGR